MSRYLACADLHIGAGGDLGKQPGERLAEQEAVWQQIIDLANERDVDAILFAGDAFHRNRPDDDLRQAFIRPMTAAQMPIYAINGNSHDFVGVGRAMAIETTAMTYRKLHLATAPSVAVMPGRTMVASLPWVPVSRRVAAQDGGDRDAINQEVAELLIQAARELHREATDRAAGEMPVILMTHFSISTATTPEGADTSVFHEPVLPLSELEAIGFDMIIAGHLHKPQLLATDPAEPVIPIFYCGSPMPLSFGEAKCEHGCWIIEGWDQTLQNGGVIHGLAPEFVPLPSRPFVTLQYPDDIRHVQDSDDLGVAGAFVKMRATLSEEDAGGFDQADWARRLVEHGGAYSVRFEVTVERARRDRGAVLAEDLTAAQQLAAYLESLSVNGSVGAAMIETAETYL